MKKLVIIAACICSALLHAEPITHRDILRVEYGGLWLQDSYLSPLLYSGEYIGLGNEWWQRFKPSERLKTKGWKHVGIGEIRGGRTFNERYTNLVYSLNLRGGWGAGYTWNWQLGASKGTEQNEVELYLGPYLDVDFMAKEIGNNTNKPFSFDIASDACILMNINYLFTHKRISYGLEYRGKINLLGVEFLQDYWTSYYELSEGVKLSESGAFTYPGNRQNIEQQLSFDFHLPHSSWRVGIRHEYLHYGTHKMPYMRQAVSAVVGTTFIYKVSAPHYPTLW